MRGERGHVDAEGSDVEGELAHGLRRIGVEEHAVLAAHGGNGGDVLDGSDLVVAVHDGNEDRVGCQGPCDRGRVHAAFGVDLEARDAETVRRERTTGIEHGLVLGRGGDDVARPAQFREPFDGQVVRLGRAGREDDFLGFGADRRSDAGTRLADGVERARAEDMAGAGGVAEHLHEIGDHRLEHARVHRRRRVAVEIDRKLH